MVALEGFVFGDFPYRGWAGVRPKSLSVIGISCIANWAPGAVKPPPEHARRNPDFHRLPGLFSGVFPAPVGPFSEGQGLEIYLPGEPPRIAREGHHHVQASRHVDEG